MAAQTIVLVAMPTVNVPAHERSDVVKGTKILYNHLAPPLSKNR
jgi:hypothetical protein